MLSPEMLLLPTIGRWLAHWESYTLSLLNLHEVMFARTIGYNFATATDDDLREAFNDWNSRVISNVPAQRLLVYNPKDGWGPLCEFLDLREPKIPFPHVNKREDMTAVLTNQLSRGAFFDRLIFNILTIFIFCCIVFTFHMLSFVHFVDDFTYFFIFVNIFCILLLVSENNSVFALI